MEPASSRSPPCACAPRTVVPARFTGQRLTFQTRLERVQWQVEGDQFECRLIQPIAGFGSGQFVRRAGEQAIFRLHSRNAG